MPSPSTPTKPCAWLVRIPEVFDGWRREILGDLQAKSMKRLGRDYDLIQLPEPESLFDPACAKFLSWRMPVHHSWPCNPQRTDGFVEKAAQALAGKFASEPVQAFLTGALDAGGSNRYYRALASNLRGRTLQLFPELVARHRNAEEQDPDRPSLFCLVGKEGLFAGVQSPVRSGGFHAGGTKFIKQGAPEVISRAGAKLAEALHHLRLSHPLPEPGSHWLELGASPGGMTAELLARGYQVTAIDRAPLDARLDNAPGLTSVVCDAAGFSPPPGVRYDALLSDMNGDAGDALAHVVRLSRFAKPSAVVVFTLKLAGAASLGEVKRTVSEVLSKAELAGLDLVQCKHLTYNRMEFTCFFRVHPLSKS